MNSDPLISLPAVWGIDALRADKEMYGLYSITSGTDHIEMSRGDCKKVCQALLKQIDIDERNDIAKMAAEAISEVLSEKV